MYSNGMGVVFSSFEVRNCTFQRMIRGFIRVQGSKRKMFENMIVENCIFVNCGYYDNNGRGYHWVAGDGKTPKSNIYNNTVFRGNVFYDSPRDGLFTDNNKSLAWPDNVKYNITLENNTFLNFARKEQQIVNMRNVPDGSIFTIRNNLFLSAKKDGDGRQIDYKGFDLRAINGAKQEITLDIENNYCSSTETDKQKNDGIFKSGAFSSTYRSAATYLNNLPGVIKGRENLVTKYTVTADGAILDPTDIFVDPCPPHVSAAGDGSDEPDYLERDLDDMLRGMKMKNTPEVTGAEFYQKKVGSSLLY